MSNIVELRKKGPEPRVLAQNGFDGVMTGHLTDKNETRDGSLTASFYLVKDLLNTPKNIKAAKAEHGDQDARDVLVGALCLAKSMFPGQPARLTYIVNDTANQYPQFSYRMLMDKCKPLLVELGILIKINATKYRWAAVDELNNLLNPVAVGAENLQQACNRPATPCNGTATGLQQPAKVLRNRLQRAINGCNLQKWVDAHQQRKALRDPWTDVLPDGSIQKHRKAFSGELSAAEKKAIRDAYERNSYSKLLSKNPELTPEAQQLAQQKQLEMIERKAAQAAQMDTLKMWAKIISFVLAVYWVIGTLGSDPEPLQTEDEFLPSGIYGDYE